MWAECPGHVVPESRQEVEKQKGQEADVQLSMVLRLFLVRRKGDRQLRLLQLILTMHWESDLSFLNFSSLP